MTSGSDAAIPVDLASGIGGRPALYAKGDDVRFGEQVRMGSIVDL
jgi:hypothetical protein